MSESKLPTLQENVENKVKKQSSRRDFIRKALFSGIAVAATAGLAKKTVSVISEGDNQQRYLDDILPGDGILSRSRYTVMSREEKETLVKMFSDSYGKGV